MDHQDVVASGNDIGDGDTNTETSQIPLDPPTACVHSNETSGLPHDSATDDKSPPDQSPAVEQAIADDQIYADNNEIYSSENHQNAENKPDGVLTVEADSESKPASVPTVDATDERDDKVVLVLGHNKLKKKTVREGAGFSSRPQHGQIITVLYSTRLDDGTEVDQNKSQTFTLGDGDVIQALDLCCALMELHEVCEIVTDAQYAYGTKGRDPDIPSNAQLTITVELLVTEDAPNYSTWPIMLRVKEANNKRERGNLLYSRGEYSAAINSYTKALSILDDRDEASHKACAEDLQLLLDARLTCYNNLAAAQIKVEAWDAAIKSCDEVLKTQPENVKALFRKGKCLGSKIDLDMAIVVLQKALKLEPQTKIIHQELSKLRAKSKRQDDSQRHMYQRMFWGTENKAAQKQRAKNSRWWLYVGGATAAGIISMSVAAYRYIHV